MAEKKDINVWRRLAVVASLFAIILTAIACGKGDNKGILEDRERILTTADREDRKEDLKKEVTAQIGDFREQVEKTQKESKEVAEAARNAANQVSEDVVELKKDVSRLVTLVEKRQAEPAAPTPPRELPAREEVKERKDFGVIVSPPLRSKPKTEEGPSLERKESLSGKDGIVVYPEPSSTLEGVVPVEVNSETGEMRIIGKAEIVSRDVNKEYFAYIFTDDGGNRITERRFVRAVLNLETRLLRLYIAGEKEPILAVGIRKVIFSPVCLTE